MAQVILSLSVPVDLYTRIEQNAKKAGISKAEAVRRILATHYGVNP